MKLKFLFSFLAMLLLFVWCILFFLALKERGLLFYIGEGAITFTLLFLIYLSFASKYSQRYSHKKTTWFLA